MPIRDWRRSGGRPDWRRDGFYPPTTPEGTLVLGLHITNVVVKVPTLFNTVVKVNSLDSLTINGEP